MDIRIEWHYLNSIDYDLYTSILDMYTSSYDPGAHFYGEIVLRNKIAFPNINAIYSPAYNLNNKIIGCGVHFIINKESVIAGAFVKSKMRNRGVGSSLLEHGIKSFQVLGLKKVFAIVTTEKQRAFFSKNKFLLSERSSVIDFYCKELFTNRCFKFYSNVGLRAYYECEV